MRRLCIASTGLAIVQRRNEQHQGTDEYNRGVSRSGWRLRKDPASVAKATAWATKSTKEFMSEVNRQSPPPLAPVAGDTVTAAPSLKGLPVDAEKFPVAHKLQQDVRRLENFDRRRWRKNFEYMRRQGTGFVILYALIYVGWFAGLYICFSLNYIPKEDAYNLCVIFLESFMIDKEEFYERVEAWDTYINLGFAFVINELLEPFRKMFDWGNWGRNWANDDLLEYRQHYPTKVDIPTANDNLNFYRNLLRAQPENILIDDIHVRWFRNYRHLERCHSYIQWIFPIQEKGLNWEAQVLMRHEIDAMKRDPAVIARIVKSFELMADFYGMAVQVDVARKTCMIKRNVVEGKELWIKCYRNLNSSGHNYLRITRILKCLGEMDLEFVKLAWLEFFAKEIYVTKALRNCGRSFADYWVGTIYDDAQRASFTKWYKALKPDLTTAPDPVGDRYFFDFDDMVDAYAPEPEAAASAGPSTTSKAGADPPVDGQTASQGPASQDTATAPLHSLDGSQLVVAATTQVASVVAPLAPESGAPHSNPTSD